MKIDKFTATLIVIIIMLIVYLFISTSSNTSDSDPYAKQKQKIDSLMLQLQDLLEEDYAEHTAIQDAFNALACALDDVVN